MKVLYLNINKKIYVSWNHEQSEWVCEWERVCVWERESVCVCVCVWLYSIFLHAQIHIYALKETPANTTHSTRLTDVTEKFPRRQGGI